MKRKAFISSVVRDDVPPPEQDEYFNRDTSSSALDAYLAQNSHRLFVAPAFRPAARAPAASAPKAKASKTKVPAVTPEVSMPAVKPSAPAGPQTFTRVSKSKSTAAGSRKQRGQRKMR